MELKTHVVFSFLVALTISLTVCTALTPQHLYLEMMRNRLQLATTAAVSSSHNQQASGRLASAPALSTITGLSSDGFFDLSVRNSLQLTTPCSGLKSKQFHPIFSSKLFLFPKLNHPDSESKEKASYDVKLSVTISSDSVDNDAVTKNVMATWNKDPRKSCMELDIMRVIRKYSMVQDEVDDHNKECTISVVVDKVTEVEDEEREQDKSSVYYSIFGNKTCSTPFIFLTHVRGILQEDEEDADSNDAESTVDRRSVRATLSKRYVTEDRNTTTEPAVSPCSVKKLNVNLTEMLPNVKILAPIAVDIHACQGSCPSSNSLREVIISRASRSNPDLNSTPCCTPSSFQSLIVLMEAEQELTIVSIEDSIVASCGCTI